MDKNSVNSEFQTRFATAASLIASLYQINISCLNSSKAIDSVCSLYSIHPSQKVFRTEFLSDLCGKIKKNEIYYITDNFQLSCTLFSLDDVPIMMGPFIKNSLSRNDAQNIVKRLRDNFITTEKLMAYHGSFPSLTRKQADIILSSFISAISPQESEKELHLIQYENKDDSLSFETTLPPVNTSLLEKRYMHEEMFKHSIMSGNSRSALYHLHMMEQDTSFYKNVGNVLHNEKIGAAIDHTVARLSALAAGLPIVILDRITSDNISHIARAQSVESVMNAKEDLIRNLCKAVFEMKSQKYSAVVQSAMYYFDRNFTEKISLHELAEDLEISENYLIKKFKSETGVTPTNYVNTIRMKRAEVLLLDGNNSINEISASVGIDDANYFVKLFKKYSGQTPSEYRKSHTI